MVPTLDLILVFSNEITNPMEFDWCRLMCDDVADDHVRSCIKWAVAHFLGFPILSSFLIVQKTFSPKKVLVWLIISLLRRLIDVEVPGRAM